MKGPAIKFDEDSEALKRSIISYEIRMKTFEEKSWQTYYKSASWMTKSSRAVHRKQLKHKFDSAFGCGVTEPFVN